MIAESAGRRPGGVVIVAIAMMMGARAPGAVRAQTPAVRAEFEVVSIKPSPRCMEDQSFHRSTPGNLVLPCVSLLSLVRMAYGRLDVLGPSADPPNIPRSGPDWVDLEHFEIIAKSAGPAHIAEMAGPMLRGLLEDRFQLRTHLESRDVPAYALTVAAGKPKVRRMREGECLPYDLDSIVASGGKSEPGKPRYCGICGGSGGTPGEMASADCFGATLAQFARLLVRAAGRPVVEQTGLQGLYEAHLEYVYNGPPLDTAWMMANGVLIRPPSETQTDPPGGPSVFTALEKQLGLKLVPTRTHQQFLIIDHAEKPAAN